MYRIALALLMLACAGSRAVADEPYVVEGLAPPADGRTGADGRINFEVPINVRQVRVILWRLNRAHVVRIGHLDPIDEPSGVRQRLQHLGYHGHTLGESAYPLAPPDQEREVLAVRAFQRDRGLTETGDVDDATRGMTAADRLSPWQQANVVVAGLGTSGFAATVLRRLAASPHRPLLVVTPPDRPKGRGRRTSPPPAAVAAQELGL